MTDREKAQAAIKLLQGTLFGYRVRSNTPRWNQSMALLKSIGLETPPPQPHYAPRTHNWAGGSDARFCMKPEFGVQPYGAGFIDSMGIQYAANGLDLGGRTGQETQIPELKGADSMDGLEPCDPYIGPTGVAIGGDAGYPPASFDR